MAGFRTWTDEDRLNAEALNGYLMGQVICRFATVIERDAQLGSPAAGMVSFVPAEGLQRFTGTKWVALASPAYLAADRPHPGSVPVGTAIWDSTAGGPSWSDGTAWVSAATSGAPGEEEDGGSGVATGAGSPEGVLTATVGTLYTRNNGSPGTLLYQKVTGAGNTGWLPFGSGAYTPLGTTITWPPPATPLRADSFNRADTTATLGQPDRTDLTYANGVSGMTAVTTKYRVLNVAMQPVATASPDLAAGGGEYPRLHYGYDDQKVSFRASATTQFAVYMRVGTALSSVSYMVDFHDLAVGDVRIHAVSNSTVTASGPLYLQSNLATFGPRSFTAPYNVIITCAGAAPTPTVTVMVNNITLGTFTDSGTVPSVGGQYVAFQIPPNGQTLDDIDFYPGFIGDTFRSAIAGTVPGSSTTALSRMTTGHLWSSFAAGSIGVQTTTGAGLMASHGAGVRVGNHTDCGNADGVVRMTWSVVTDAKMMALFRYADDDNYWFATTTQLKKRIAGVDSVIGTFTTPFSALDSLSAVLNGSSVEIRRNNITVLAPLTDTFNATSIRHGMCGDGTGATTTSRVTDWRFTPAP